MNSQNNAYLESMPEYQLHQRLLGLEAKLIDLILHYEPELEES